MDNPPDNQRTNPRFNRSFPLELRFGQLTVHGRAVAPSAFGCTVEITEYEYNQLLAAPALWENNRRITVTTNLNDLCAEVGSLQKTETGEHLISIKLCDDRTWYN